MYIIIIAIIIAIAIAASPPVLPTIIAAPLHGLRYRTLSYGFTIITAVTSMSAGGIGPHPYSQACP
eukprot:768613-Hanusia_phi.AAC.1